MNAASAKGICGQGQKHHIFINIHEGGSSVKSTALSSDYPGSNSVPSPSSCENLRLGLSNCKIRVVIVITRIK